MHVPPQLSFANEVDSGSIQNDFVRWEYVFSHLQSSMECRYWPPCRGNASCLYPGGGFCCGSLHRSLWGQDEVCLQNTELVALERTSICFPFFTFSIAKPQSCQPEVPTTLPFLLLPNCIPWAEFWLPTSLTKLTPLSSGLAGLLLCNANSFLSEFELVGLHWSHRSESCSYKNSYENRHLFWEFKEQNSTEAICKE